jgi:hypothetical protein
MAADESSDSELNTGYEIFIGALTVLSLVNIVLLSLLRDESLQTVVYAIDALLSIVFLIDFLARLRRAPSRLDYVFRQFGWADLLASLPFPQVKILRVFRLIRVTRLLRRYGAGNIAPEPYQGPRGECSVVSLIHRGARTGVRQLDDPPYREERR